MMSKTETSGDDAAEEWSTWLTGKKTLPFRQNEEVVMTGYVYPQ